MQKNPLKEFLSLGPYFRKYRVQYIFGFICLLLVDAAQMVLPQFIRQAIDLISSGNVAWIAILKISLAMVAVAVVISSGRFLWRYFIHGSSRRIEAELREKLFNHFLTLSYDFYQANKIGDLMARMTNDLNAVRMAIGMGFVALIDGTAMATAILIVMFIQAPHVALPAVLPLPIITLLILKFGSLVGKLFMRVQQSYSSVSDIIQETFAGIRVIKSFVKESWFVGKFSDSNDDYKAANMALAQVFGFFFPLITFLSGFTTLILLVVGGRSVMEGRLSPGELVALLSYLQMLVWPIMGVGFMINMMQRGAASLNRVNEILNTKPTIVSPPEPKRVESKESYEWALEFRDLTWGYSESTPILQNVSLKIPEGSMVGILGRTGSGKSTLLKTLTRTVDPPEGTVFVKGLDVRHWDLGALRRIFGVTPQDSYLFSDSIKNNVSFGLAQIPREPTERTETEDVLIRTAIEIASMGTDLADFKDGWNTVIGERGLTLSGGQKQRIAIARAMIRQAEILVLDDALSAVDVETEKKILSELMNQRRGKTTLLVSHRVSTLRHADYVVVLENGRVIEEGSPKDLEKTEGFYGRMARLQSLVQAEKGDPT